MKASRFISERLEFRGRITVAATAVSFLVIILSMMVLGGFRREIRGGVGAVMGDVQMTGDSVSTGAAFIPELLKIKGVEGITPAIYNTAVVRSGDSIDGVLFKAVPSNDSTLTASVPSTLAGRLGIGVGDRLTAYFVGERVKVRNFTVREVYRDLLRADGSMIVYVSLEDLQRVNGWDSTRVGALEVTLSDRFRSPEKEKAKAAELSMTSALFSPDGGGLAASAAADRYARLFDWLGLLDFNVLAILLLMTLVAGFNMISGLLIVLFRHTGTIGTLKAMGMDNRGIAAVFLRMSSRVVFKGMAIGGGLALLFALVQGTTHLLRLNPDNYFVSFVPVAVNVPQILLVCAAAWAAIMLLLLLPSLFIARVDPADTVRVK